MLIFPLEPAFIKLVEKANVAKGEEDEMDEP